MKILRFFLLQQQLQLQNIILQFAKFLDKTQCEPNHYLITISKKKKMSKLNFREMDKLLKTVGAKQTEIRRIKKKLRKFHKSPDGPLDLNVFIKYLLKTSRHSYNFQYCIISGLENLRVFERYRGYCHYANNLATDNEDSETEIMTSE